MEEYDVMHNYMVTNHYCRTIRVSANNVEEAIELAKEDDNWSDPEDNGEGQAGHPDWYTAEPA